MKEIAPQTYLIDAQYFQEGFNAVYLIVSHGNCPFCASIRWQKMIWIGNSFCLQKAKNAKLWTHPKNTFNYK